MGDQVRHQVHAPRGVRPGDHDALAHPRVTAQDRLHLAELDPVAAHLHHVVGTAQELHPAVHRPPAAVAGAVQALTRLNEVRQKALGGQVRTAEVSAREAGARHVQLARGTDGHRQARAVQHPDLRVGQRHAQGKRP